MKKRRTKFKIAMGVAAVATSLLIAMVPACSTTEEPAAEEENKTSVDSQLIKNGNFEFYEDNDGLYPISNADNWTINTKGNSSTSMSGVINTSAEKWSSLTDPALAQKLDDNDALSSDDENKVDYNGATSDDLLYKNSHVALGSSAEESDPTMIANPLTHKYSYDTDGNILDAEGQVLGDEYKDEDGKLYSDKEHTQPVETSVLMLHNFRKSYYTGTETYAKSSTTLTLEANTACEISLWVKTCELYFDGSNASRTKVSSERGAYIQVSTQVAGNNVDDFVIRNINTEKLNEGDGEIENNGWIQYTVYVEASTFANTTVNLTLGLGESDIYTVEGYAFFDDIQFTQYTNKAKLAENVEGFETKVKDTTYYPLETERTSKFRVDKETIKTNDADGKIKDHVDLHSSEHRHFFINFADTTKGESITLGNTNVKAGYTVDETTTGKYVCSQDSIGTLNVTQLANNINSEYIIPAGIKNKLKVSSDIITTFSGITSDDWTCGLNKEYDAVINDALKSAHSLPGATGNALLMLSARGATYEAQIEDNSFSLADGENALISFWVKTSDMDGKTAATITVIDTDDKNNTSRFTVDSTTESAIDIGEEKDIYSGWVRCFVRVSNTSEEGEAKTFKIKVNFGNTTIKGTTLSNYNSGWLAIANMSIMKNLDKDVFKFSSSISNCATVTFGEKNSNSSFAFDSELGDKNEIESDLAIPSSYTGVNGASTYVYPSHSAITPEDAANANDYAGLMSKENFGEYTDKDWYKKLSQIEGGATGDELWNKVAGDYSVQPLIIVNNAKDGKINNYGYIAKNSLSVSSNGYTAISVKVKVSDGAVANIYLVETGKESEGAATYNVPKFTFWYDDAGNILKGEPAENATRAQKKANIAYTLRADGLYSKENDDKLYANLYNLSRYYDVYHLEQLGVYTVYLDGQPVNISQIEDGVDYYADAEGNNYAPHYLVAGGANNKVYDYVSGMGDNVTYNYMEKGKANTSKLVHAIDRNLAVPRYTEDVAEPYQFTIDTTTEQGKKYADKWITVTFNIHAGSVGKNFKLELWSGARDQKTTASAKDSYVIFDRSSVSLDSSTYSERLSAYSDEIIAEYKEILADNGIALEDNDGTIADLEKLVTENNLSSNYNSYKHVASYYTFSLYDSPSFIPFNAETAEDPKAGYSYSYSDYSESLAYLKVEDEENYSLNTFIDYSVLDKDIEIIGVPTVPETEEETDDNKNTGDSANIWLLAASIVLVVAIFFTVAVLLLRSYLKKHKKTKTAGKNSYNFNKNKRYVKKYVKANGEAPELKDGEFEEGLLNDSDEEEAEESEQTTEVEESEESAEETPVEETVEETPAEEPAEDAAEETPAEAPAEEPEMAPVEETKEEAPVEEPKENAKEAPTEETPAAEDDKKDE